jgi:hypothetical protein
MTMTDPFAEQGFAVRRLPIEERLTTLRSDILDVFDLARRHHGDGRVTSDRDLVEFFRTAPDQQYHAYQRINRLPALNALAGDPSLVEFVRSLGLRHPVVDVHLQIRCDMPVAEQRLAPAHQDWSHNLGSEQSVTVWIPLQDTPVHGGALRVAPASHRYGLFPHVDGFMLEFPADLLEPVPVSFGEVLVFRQTLVHASGRNDSDTVRFTAVVRFSDLAEPEYLERGWYWNHGHDFAGHAAIDDHPERFGRFEDYYHRMGTPVPPRSGPGVGDSRA